jgi:thiol-disulfide isomerase/thioredoxin
VRNAAAAVLLGLLLASGCASGQDAADPGAAGRNRFVAGDGTTQRFQPAARVAAPKVVGDLLGGGRYDLKRQRGTVVVLNFWASWCAPCRLEAPELAEVYQKTRSKGVAFVGINIRDDKDKAQAFEESFAVPYPSLFDPAGRTALGFREVPPNAIPATIVIDREGRVAAVFRKALLREDLAPVVRQIAAET